MSKIFEDLYCGKLGMREERPKDGEYEKADKEFGKIMDQVENALPEKKKELLDELFLRGADVTAILEYLSYKEGFRAGLMLGMDMSRETYEK